MIEVISQYIDLELACIIIAAILLFIVLNLIFRKVSMPVILKNMIIICAILGIGFLSYNYLEKEEVSYVESLSNNYIVGKVQFVGKSVDKISIKPISANIPIKNKQDVTVKVSSSTDYLLKKGYEPEARITIDQIMLGDVITIYCKENSLTGSENEITARKIIKKES